MSKTAKEIGLIIGGLALALVAGPVGIVALQGNVAMFNAMVGIGVTTALTGVGLALRPSANTAVGAQNTVSVGSGPQPRRVLYGQLQTAGVCTFGGFPPLQNQSTTNQYLELIYTLTGHEISSFDAVVIDGTVYNFGTDLVYDGTDHLWHLDPGSSPSYTDFYWQHIFFDFDFGRNSSTQPFANLQASDSSWTSACLQRGCSKVLVVCRADSSWTALFPSGAIPNIQFLVTGKKLIDTRIVTAWQPSTTYDEWNWTVDPLGRIWVQTVSSGVSGTVTPNFNGVTSFPYTLADNTCSWTSYGQQLSNSLTAKDVLPQGHIVNGRLMNDAWSPNGDWAVGDIIEAPLGYLQYASNAGISGASYPTFSTTLGGTTTDNTQDWVCLGRSPHAINPSNPALCVYDYLTDTDAGLGAFAGGAPTYLPSTIDTSSVNAAANTCEEQVVIIVNADTTFVYENLYSCDGMFDHSSVRGNVLTSLCASMAGYVVPPGDLWHVFPGAVNTPTVTLGDGDMRGPIKGDFRLSKRDVCNSVKGQYVPAYLPVNPAAAASMTQLPGLWQLQSFPAYQANGMAGKPDYLNSEDGGQIIWLDIQLDFVTSLWQAQRLAKIALMRTRFQQTLTLPCKITALQFEAGDTFGFTHERWGILSQWFEITQISVTMDGSSGRAGTDDAPVLGVDIIARQTDPSIYEFQAPTSSTVFGEYSQYGITGIMTGVE